MCREKERSAALVATEQASGHGCPAHVAGVGVSGGAESGPHDQGGGSRPEVVEDAVAVAPTSGRPRWTQSRLPLLNPSRTSSRRRHRAHCRPHGPFVVDQQYAGPASGGSVGGVGPPLGISIERGRHPGRTVPVPRSTRSRLIATKSCLGTLSWKVGGQHMRTPRATCA